MGEGRTSQSDSLVALAVVAVAYYVSARLGLRLALVGNVVTPLWPPTGVAVVALRARGYRVWPAIAVAALAVNVVITDPPLAAAGIAVGNTLAPVVAVWLLRRFGVDERLARLKDATTLVAVALAAMTISASVGTATLAFASGSSAGALRTWWVWWTGDAMGVLIVAPVLWAVARARITVPDTRTVVEATAVFGGLVAGAFIAVRTEDGLLFLVLPFLAWIAWRFHQPGAAPAGLIASVIVIAAATGDAPAFAGMDTVRRMVVLQLFNASVALTSFIFAAAVTERRHFLESQFEREHRVAVALQRSMLPDDLPEVPGLALAARYQPSSVDARIGGDWYDVIPLGGDRMGIAVGDVAGHGVAAASVMAQIRMALRAHALERRGPAHAIARVNRLVRELYPGAMATVLYGELDLGRGDLRYVSAGHVPALLLPVGGSPRYLDGRTDVPLGVADDAFTESAVLVPDNATLLLFTDGLIERRTEAIDVGLEQLIRACEGASRDVEDFCDHVVTKLASPAANDDVALLAVRTTSLAGQTLRLRVPATAVAVGETRHVLRRWLVQNGGAADEVFEILLACTEAQTNAVQHAYRRDDGVIDIEASPSDAGEIVVVIRDQGSWREQADLGAEDRGRGASIIRTLTEAEFTTDAQGTEVRIRRQLLGWPTSSPRS